VGNSNVKLVFMVLASAFDFAFHMRVDFTYVVFVHKCTKARELKRYNQALADQLYIVNQVFRCQKVDHLAQG
jgi:hypothetical protein